MKKLTLNVDSYNFNHQFTKWVSNPENRRMQKAKDLLETSDLTISEISIQVGITNLSYFSRIFSEEFGQSPTQFKG